MAVFLFHTPIVSISSTAVTTSLLPTNTKSSNLAPLPVSSCFILRSLSKIPCLNLLRATPLQKYVYPDPVPGFAVHVTKKFREELKKKLYKERDTFGDDLDKVIDTCTELFSEFVHKEYGGPGTLVVDPFTDMFTGLKLRKLPGANLAARASLLWAQNYLDHDWEIWNSKLE